jgi:hypothetical protein
MFGTDLRGLPVTTVRLAYNPGPINAYKALDMGPTVRLAFADGQAERPGNPTFGDAPTVRFATTTAMFDTVNQSAKDRIPFHAEARDPSSVRPALLVSYVYLKPFLANRHRYHYRDWVLDSGAFSAHNSGTEIKLQDYIDTCKRLRDDDPTLTEVFALDVIGDWRASIKNAEEMWRQGIEAIPCYHVGEPESALRGIAKDYPKIALGGCVGFRGKDKFAAQCFARVWPKKIHGFGFGTEKSLMNVPWHSVDATNWEIGPCKFGRWNAFGNMSVRGSKQNLRAEVEWYLALEVRARQRWAKEMAQLEATTSPSVRLALGSTDGPNCTRYASAFEDKPE